MMYYLVVATLMLAFPLASVGVEASTTSTANRRSSDRQMVRVLGRRVPAVPRGHEADRSARLHGAGHSGSEARGVSAPRPRARLRKRRDGLCRDREPVHALVATRDRAGRRHLLRSRRSESRDAGAAESTRERRDDLRSVRSARTAVGLRRNSALHCFLHSVFNEGGL